MLSKRYTGPYEFSLADYKLLENFAEKAGESDYVISIEVDKLRFRNKTEYTLFFILKQEDKALLQGLDGYGMRDESFNKKILKLIQKIKDDK